MSQVLRNAVFRYSDGPKPEDLSGHSDVYTKKYDGDTFFADVNGRSGVVCFK